jgi:inorganic triphosphatase YgiF
VPCFSTRFDRTSWLIRTKDHSLVEVALDIGQIESDHQAAPICELELELKAGNRISLFDVGLNIAARVAVLPASLSKAERGYMLAAGTLDMPVRSAPPQLSTKQTLVAAAQQIFRESFSQFTKNLEMAMLTDNPEVVHQARVGWRRFKSALRLFKPVLAWDQLPDMSALRPLLDSLGHLRDLDVALTETLPSTVLDYVSLDSNRQKHWDNFERSLATAAQAQRAVIRKNMQSPAMGVALLSMTRYIEGMTSSATVVTGSKVRSLESWTVRRLKKLKNKLKQSTQDLPGKDEQHLVRIHAKRLRYGLESMQTLLPKHRVKKWLKKAAAMQGSMGLRRDFQRLVQLANEFGAETGVVEFLRGYGTGLDHQGRT